MVFVGNGKPFDGIERGMKISTLVELDLLRRYAELGLWSTATDLYFNMCLDGLDPARCEELQEAVWARDSSAMATAVSRLARASQLLVDFPRVKPLEARNGTLLGDWRTSYPAN